ncbi:glycosyltransferase [Neobacillus mesonae]|nr:glycosyltransferase [Neobacillus mesonae]
MADIPFLYHPISLATNPVKTYEYMSTGVKALSTALPECIRMESHVTTATTHEDFINKLGKMLSEGDDPAASAARIAYAQQNTWVQREERPTR